MEKRIAKGHEIYPGADLTDTYFTRADLTDAILTDAILTGTIGLP